MSLALAGMLSLVAVSAVNAASPEPVAADATAGTTGQQEQGTDIPWGLAGLLGLAGLMGLNRDRDRDRGRQGQISNPARP